MIVKKVRRPSACVPLGQTAPSWPMNIIFTVLGCQQQVLCPESPKGSLSFPKLNLGDLLNLTAIQDFF
jgi:hypothetical protein